MRVCSRVMSGTVLSDPEKQAIFRAHRESIERHISRLFDAEIMILCDQITVNVPGIANPVKMLVASAELTQDCSGFTIKAGMLCISHPDIVKINISDAEGNQVIQWIAYEYNDGELVHFCGDGFIRYKLACL